MNSTTHLSPSRDSGWSSYFSNVLVWVLFATAGFLLMWFVSVLNDVTQRGEQRRLQQRTTGSLILADEAARRAPQPVAALTVSSETLPVR
ncbi:MAG: hypothetical protein KIT86_21395 [Hydrogenophaga sp.]|jgi:hypothetical protein|uniref:hypothetical protein n=1 Tax=Hydrogenophaga sp. TaxID=1904254 RepID=UPI0026364B73|nr:hypothetical protein [Hydrogenophaga sp.]MCW5672223.1 hypothetical protein [Hydrogenophaga sp.]